MCGEGGGVQCVVTRLIELIYSASRCSELVKGLVMRG